MTKIKFQGKCDLCKTKFTAKNVRRLYCDKCQKKIQRSHVYVSHQKKKK